MKIIISHDIDHLKWSEHFFKDNYILKHIFRTFNWYTTGKISVDEFYYSFTKFINPRIHRLPELVQFNKHHNIPSTFFVGMANGSGLKYSFSNASMMVKWLYENEQEVGVHGINHLSQADINNEFNKFTSIKIGNKPFGIRMHYLRNNIETFKKLAAAGYSFDSTEYAIKDPYLINGMMEFPLCLMESYVWREAGTNIEKMINFSKRKIEEAHNKNLNYFTINFHDLHFDNSTDFLKKWYENLIVFLVNNNYEFTTFEKAKNELQYHIHLD